MRIILVALIATFVLGAFAVTDPEVASMVNKMEGSKYGKTLLDTIAL
jgi:hypothetical protein